MSPKRKTCRLTTMSLWATVMMAGHSLPSSSRNRTMRPIVVLGPGDIAHLLSSDSWYGLGRRLEQRGDITPLHPSIALHPVNTCLRQRMGHHERLAVLHSLEQNLDFVPPDSSSSPTIRSTRKVLALTTCSLRVCGFQVTRGLSFTRPTSATPSITCSACSASRHALSANFIDSF